MYAQTFHRLVLPSQPRRNRRESQSTQMKEQNVITARRSYSEQQTDPGSISLFSRLAGVSARTFEGRWEAQLLSNFLRELYRASRAAWAKGLNKRASHV